MKSHPATFIVTAAFIAIYLLGLTGCQTPILEQDQETVEMLQNVFYEASYYQYDEEAETYTVYNTNKKQIGYAFYAEGMGVYIPPAEGEEKIGGPIIILVGLEDKETIKGIFVISHCETVGVWDLLVKKNYLNQFEGLKINDAYFTSSGGQVDSITGATLSSTLVLNTVRETALEKFIPIEIKKEWQNIVTLALVIPFILIPVVFIWYTTIKQARVKRVP